LKRNQQPFESLVRLDAAEKANYGTLCGQPVESARLLACVPTCLLVKPMWNDRVRLRNKCWELRNCGSSRRTSQKNNAMDELGHKPHQDALEPAIALAVSANIVDGPDDPRATESLGRKLN
jgi:hypothetical protein